MRHYIKGDVKEDGSNFIAFDDDDMKYNETDQRYILKESYLINKLGVDIKSFFRTSKEAEQFLDEQSENVYRKLLTHAHYHLNKEIVLFKIGRTKNGRDTIKKAMTSQVKWSIRTGNDMLEEDISKNALNDLKSGGLKIYNYAYCVDPNEVNEGY
jgi:hypothetical protein